MTSYCQVILIYRIFLTRADLTAVNQQLQIEVNLHTSAILTELRPWQIVISRMIISKLNI